MGGAGLQGRGRPGADQESMLSLSYHPSRDLKTEGINLNVGFIRDI